MIKKVSRFLTLECADINSGTEGARKPLECLENAEFGKCSNSMIWKWLKISLRLQQGILSDRGLTKPLANCFLVEPLEGFFFPVPGGFVGEVCCLEVNSE